MSLIDSMRKIEITVLNVDSIPCSIIGNNMIFNFEGKMLTKPWILKWPMPWIEKEFIKIALEQESVTKKTYKRIYNHEEPDQYVDVLVYSYIDLTVSQLVDQISDYYPDREAVVNNSGSIRLKYKYLKKQISNLAKGLLSIGVQKDDKISVWAVNSPEFIIAQFGICKAGGIFVPLNAYEKQNRMEVLLKSSDTNTLIMQVGYKSTENIELLYSMIPELKECIKGNLKSEKFPMLKNVIVISEDEYSGMFKWTDILEYGENLADDVLDECQKNFNHDDVAHIIFTSGSTGTPKGVMLSHENIIENAESMSDRMELTENDIMCIQAPLFHCFGTVACSMAAVTKGCSMIMVKKFKTENTLALIEREKCTVLSGVPTLFVACIEQMQKTYYDTSSIRTGIVAGASCSSKMIEEINSVMGIQNIIVSYGLTETSPCVTATYANDSLEIRTTTVGKTVPGVEVKIMDVSTKASAASGQDGEILVKGYNVMKGYYKMHEETEKAIDNEGWLHTGDIGCLTHDGYLCMKGRSKDIIIRSGENISPMEIENYLLTHEDVSEVCVIGVPDYLCGEEIMAFVKLEGKINLTEDEIKEFCKGKIASNKIPRYIVFVEEFPLSDSGKILKRELRKLALKIIENKEVCECQV
ncbi:fatty-acyl-CoA synthase [Sedimentibacter acidaminivorans]|uniref:Fatty-acyl-CoA synthase n=1 Tax=Sedimentibacter acidaminivorans TaxID=913099 RepID=A0ABS4GIA4_9FIRM|nr:AMP-binding protein [Sedimentibacter acidaminivorans]MBP1927425.1 fatty-acyl-CoA synthase [Sedimentibacter acidaminivorans]